MGTTNWIQSLGPDERRALVLIKAYEDCRRAKGQFGYTALPYPDERNRDTPIFKQFKTVVLWLAEKGWVVGWREAHWQGYVKHAFETLAPTIPMPGQLKNEVILKSYLTAPKDTTVDPVYDVAAIYGKALHPKLRTQAFRHTLGI